MSTKALPEDHRDLLGREVNEGDAVAYTHHNSLYVGKVIKITPKQVRVVPMLSNYRSDTGYLKYTNQCVLIGGPELTAHLLKNM
jgi:hypothetical protein